MSHLYHARTCWVRTSNYDSFHWKQALIGDMILKNFVKKIKIWHLLCGITFWTIWIECKDKVFSQEQWYESKVNYLIMYAKVAWE